MKCIKPGCEASASKGSTLCVEHQLLGQRVMYSRRSSIGWDSVRGNLTKDSMPEVLKKSIPDRFRERISNKDTDPKKD